MTWYAPLKIPVHFRAADLYGQHHELLLKVFNGEIHLAPIGTNPQRIIDIGTGTGIWAIDAADKYPSAEVIGTDLRYLPMLGSRLPRAWLIVTQPKPNPTQLGTPQLQV